TGRIWISSYYHGLAEYITSKDSIVKFKTRPYGPYRFEGQSANSVFEDRQNNIWIGTKANGVYRFNPNRKRVQFYSQNNYDHTELQSGSVISIAPLDQHTLMIGTMNGPSFFDKKTNTFRNFKGHAYNFGDKAL